MMDKRIEQSVAADGIDRRGFLKCMAWVGTGLVWTVGSGIPGCVKFEEAADEAKTGDFSFAQISDSHIGFSKEPNKDVTATLQAAIDKLNALKEQPSFLLHTGDLTHLSKSDEFDKVGEVLKGFKGGPAFFVPGEHDLFADDGKGRVARPDQARGRRQAQKRPGRDADQLHREQEVGGHQRYITRVSKQANGRCQPASVGSRPGG
jgi:Calcineurin-like phosphoesterase